MQAINNLYQESSQQTKAWPISKPATVISLTKKQFWHAVNMVVPGFVADASNIPLLNLLYLYTARDVQFEQEGYSLDKGLLLYGNVGSGKTDLLRSVQRAFWAIKSPMSFAYVNMNSVVEDFGELGFSTMNQYERKNWMFDELGQVDKELVGNYSNKINAAENIILKRYEQFRYGYLSHFTTNLSRQEIQSHYDGRVWSRLQEMCNMIRVVGPDRRPDAQPKRPQLHRPAPEPVPAYTDAMKRETILAEAEKLRQGQSYRFLDVGGVHYQHLVQQGVITPGADPELEAEEMHRMITAARVTDLDSQSRKQLKAFQEAEDMPPENKYTKELAYRIEKRMLKETIEKLASGELNLNLNLH